MTTPATISRRGTPVSRDLIIQNLRDYAELFGDDFTTSAFNPSVAKWRDRPEDRERYLAGNPKTGLPWPSLNTIKAAFDGSFNDARVAAGLTPNKPGPSKRGRRADHTVAPIRDGKSDRVRVVTRVVTRDVTPDASTNASTNEVRAVERRAEKAEGALAKATERLAAARQRGAADRAALAKVRARRDRAADEAVALRAQARDLGQSLGRALTRAEAADRKADQLSADLITTTEELDDVRLELERARELRTLADPAELERARVEVRDARARVAAAEQAQARAEGDARAAGAAQRAAEVARDRAERDAAREAGLRGEVTRAVAGHDRALSPAEVEALREQGPSGPAVFTAAVKAVAKAQARGGRAELGAALRAAASAAIRWSDRL